MTVGERVKLARLARGETQQDVARRAGVSESWICRLENGYGSGWKAHMLISVMRALDLQIQVEDLVDDVRPAA